MTATGGIKVAGERVWKNADFDIVTERRLSRLQSIMSDGCNWPSFGAIVRINASTA